MSRSVLAGVVATFALTGGAWAAEQPVAIDHDGERIAGILNLPDGVENPPVVLMLHGFTSQKNETPITGTDMGLYSLAAARMAEAGIASLRIDFTGSGESSGAWEDTTFSGQLSDAIAAFDHLQTMPQVDGDRIGILGFSQGGMVGAHLAAARPEAGAVVLWAPVTNPLLTYSTILGVDAVEAGIASEAEDAITADLPSGGQITLKGRFFHELPRFSTAAAVALYPGPLRVIVGLNETIVPHQPHASEQLLDYHRGVEDLVTVESDHDFGAGTSIELPDGVLVPGTAEWFAEHL